MGDPTDSELARRCRQGDAGAWRVLVRRLTPTAWRVAARMLGPGPEAEDATQEVFVRVHRSFDTYDATRPLAPWVCTIAYNVCLRRLDRARRRPADPVDPGDLDRMPAGDGDGPAERREGAEAGELLARALDTLPAQDRVLLGLRYREGLSDAEVAQVASMPVNTVKTRIFRARQRLRGLLGPVLGE